MEAFRLVEAELEQFTAGERTVMQSWLLWRRILDDPKVSCAARTIEHLVGAPPLVPTKGE
jgi:hypothetical protein